MKYGVTSSATVEGTINPDFSQVESDAFQVEVNQRFPLFYSEKRPFFMEGMGTFELAGVGGDAIMRTAVHTRRIVDPFWGGKTTGTPGGSASPSSPPATTRRAARLEGRAANPFPGERKNFYIARGQYSLGRSNYVGAILTDTQFGEGHNRVAGADVSLRRGKHSRERHPPGLDDAVPRRHQGQGRSRAARPSTRSRPSPSSFATQIEHYDRGFQMDTAFLNQVGITPGLELRWPRASIRTRRSTPWFKRVTPFVFARYGRDRIQRGDPWIVRVGRAHELHAAGLLPRRHRLRPRAVGGADLRTHGDAAHGGGPAHALAQHVVARTSFGALDLLRLRESLSRPAAHRTRRADACSRARASTSRCPTIASSSTGAGDGRACTPSTC